MTSIASMIRTHRGADEVFAVIIVQYMENPKVNFVAFENHGGPPVKVSSIPSARVNTLALINDSHRNWEKIWTNTSIERPSGELVDAVRDAAQHTGVHRFVPTGKSAVRS